MNTQNLALEHAPVFDDISVGLRMAFDHTGRIIESTTAEDLDLPTPCPGWNVATIEGHIVEALDMFGAAVTGRAPSTVEEANAEATIDVAAAFRRSGDATLAAWATPGRMDRPVQLPFGQFPALLAAQINLLETFVHGCDIAKATGREELVDQSLCASVQDMAIQAGFDAFRLPGMFGPEVKISETRSDLDRLLSYVGRTV